MKSEILDIVGQRVSKIRKQRKLTQEELASEIGVDRRTIGAIEHGSTSRSENFIAVIQTLEISMDDILYNDEFAALKRDVNEFEAVDRNAILRTIRVLIKSIKKALS